MADKNKILEHGDFVKGLRVGNISVKIYKYPDNSYLAIRRRYFLGIPIYTKCCIMDDYESAEDLIRGLKFDGQCGKLV